MTNQLMKTKLAELDRLKFPTDYKIKKRINEDHLDEIQSQLSDMKMKSPTNFMNKRNRSHNTRNSGAAAEDSIS